MSTQLWIILGVAAYLIVGVFALGLLSRWNKSLNPLMLVGDGLEVLIFLIFVALWPIWLILALFSRSQPPGANLSKKSARKAALIGHSGTAVTDLRPSGKVEVDGTIHDAQAATGFIARGSPVKVVATHAFGIEVRPVQGD